MPVVGLYCIV